MNNIEFGSVGVLQIGNARYGFRPMEVYSEFGHAPIMKGEFLPDVFATSNLRAKAVEYLADMKKSPEIKTVIFNDPATIVIWTDGSKTVVKCQPGDTYSKETGLALCIAKKFLGNKGNFNEVFKKWIHEKKKISVEKMRVELYDFCHSRMVCHGCPLQTPVCRCGCGTHFRKKKRDETYDMSDAEIESAYKVAFGEG